VLAQNGAPPPLHSIWLARQVVPHLPPLHTSPGVHAIPHMPQFAGSFASSTQDAPHIVVPPPHDSAQCPPEQTCPPVHVVPHPPQLSGSVIVFAQPLGQDFSPALHVTPVASGWPPLASGWSPVESVFIVESTVDDSTERFASGVEASTD
jgi:hypothetical protein